MKFLKDKRGVAEEFTSLPALVVVMIGFALFFAMLANLYISHNEKIKEAELAEVAHYVSIKLTNGESPLTDAPLIINKEKWNNTNLTTLKEYCNLSSYDYCLAIKPSYGLKKFNGNPDGDKFVVSRKVAIKMEDGDVKYGKIFVTVWRKK
ncbi:MAG TPA: hypothetical protein ENG71_04030 [Thermoplasmatales archaeon]|nr:hypothetical protein [Thermoplasmatales archaeon]